MRRCSIAAVDPAVHKRYLEYRERHRYFGGAAALLTREEFVDADTEQRALDAKGEARDDDEEARFAELSQALFRD